MSAMDDEIKLLVADLELTETRTIAHRDYLRGKLYGNDAVLALSRWGKVAAAQTATTLLTQYPIEKLIFTGVAGGADPSLSIGDIVISSELVQYDVDASPVPPMRRFEIPLLGISHFSADTDLIQKAEHAAHEFTHHTLHTTVAKADLEAYHIRTPKVASGVIASGDRFIADTETIHELRTSIAGLRCVEMEGAAVAQVCYEHDVPFVVVRVISDNADHSAVIDFPMFVSRIAAQYTQGIIRGMLS